ncbi:MAG: TRAP transporter large permease [Agathobaculum sp.]|jgi:tripartite ATP-independent transporter DctM subunit|uniref:TRAP transporter large permease n=1 Tax=Agathobaculum sp. TaxID=2048138 RepID=UPI003D8F36D0
MAFTVWLPIAVLFVLLFMKIPVAFSLATSTLMYFMLNPGSMTTDMVVQNMISGTTSFTYLAIPFFTAAGVIFNYSGITERLMNLCELIVGKFAGGLAQVNIVLSALMGGLSGSANADAAMQSKMLVPQMNRLGYSNAFSTVVTVVSSCITPIIPPGICLILYATASGVSIASMFYAGYLPGALIMAAEMVMGGYMARKRGYKATRERFGTAKEFAQNLKQSIWALFLPFGLVMGLRMGVFTPTEAGAMCIVYALLVGALIYRTIKPKMMIPIIRESVEATSGIMFIICASLAFGKFLTWERIPMIISEAILSICHTQWQFLLLVNVLLIIVGMFFEGGAAMILLAPLLVPAAQSLGVNLIHFGIVMCINLTIAGVTPPFGAMMFVSTSITGCSFEDYCKEVWPWCILLFGVLFLLTYVPDIILCVPRLLGAAGV